MNFSPSDIPSSKGKLPGFDYRAFYNEIVDVRERELHLPEEQKTLKTATFLAIEREYSTPKIRKHRCF